MREIKTGEYYRHFQGDFYQVTGIAKESQTGRDMIVYQELEGEPRLLVCGYEEFLEEVDKERYPEVGQQYRFEKVEEPIGTNPLLLQFLEAKTYEDKLELFNAWEAYADDQLLESIAEALDVVLKEGTTKEKYRQIRNCLRTMEHFETKRFR